MKSNSKILANLGLTLACWAVTYAVAQPGVAGLTQFVSGDVRISGVTGQERPLKKGDAVNEGDTVTCGPSASTQIRMQDGGLIAVRPDTALKFDQFVFGGQQDGNEKSVFSLLKGGFRAVTGLIGQVNKKNYKINTPVATIGIRGTDHETFLIVPGSTMAQIAPSGAYSKVNVGETTLTTDRGTVNVLPNQMGFAGGLNQLPQVQVLNTSIFTVARSPTSQAKLDKKDEKKEQPVQNNADGKANSPAAQAAAPVDAEPVPGVASTPVVTAAPAAQETSPIRSTAATDSVAPSAALIPSPASSVVAPVVAAVAAAVVAPTPVPTTVPATAVDSAGSSVNLTTATAISPSGQVIPISQSLIASQAQAAADAALLAATEAAKAANLVVASGTAVTAMAPISTAPAKTAIDLGTSNIATAGTTVNAATALAYVNAATAIANANTAQTAASTAAAQAAVAQAALTSHGLFADTTAVLANGATQNANGLVQTANTAVQSAATAVTVQNTALTSAQGTASSALATANTLLNSAAASLATVDTQNALISSAQGSAATQVTLAQTAAASAQAAATAANTAASRAAVLQAAGDLAGAQTQLLIAQQQLKVSQAEQATAISAQTAIANQLAAAQAAATTAGSAVTAATADGNSAATAATTAGAQAAAAQTASTNANAALSSSGTNLAAVIKNATVVAANAPTAAYNNPAVVGNFIAATMFPVATAGGFNHASAPSAPQQPNTQYVLDGLGNLVEARNLPFQLQTNQNGTLLTPAITGVAGADFKWSGGAAADTIKLADNSIYMGRWTGATVTVTDNATSTNGVSYTPVSSLWAVLLPPPAGYVPNLVGTSTYTKSGNTTPVDAFGNLGILNSATLTANFTTQLADAAVNLTVGAGPMAGTFNVDGKSMTIDPNGGFGVASAGALTTRCAGTCADQAGGYSADLGGSLAGMAAAGAGMSYNIWPTVASSSPASDSVQGLVAFTAPAPTVKPPLAYTATATAVAYTGGNGGGFNDVGGSNFIAALGDITPLATPTTFTENYGGAGGYRTDILNGASTATATTTMANGISFGIWDTVASVSSFEKHVMLPSRQGSGSMLPVYMYGDQGYLDAPVVFFNSVTGSGNTGPLLGTFAYQPVAKLSLDQNTWKSGNMNTATLNANFTNQTVNLALGGTIGANNWSADSASMPINFMNTSSGAGARFYDSAPVIKVATSTITGTTPVCASCAGNISGEFIGQNYAGAIVQYGLWDNAPAAGMNVAGLLAFDRLPVTSNPSVSNAAAAPTGTTVLANSWQFQSPTVIITDNAGLLTGWGGTGWNSTVTPATGSVPQTAVGNGSGTIHWGQWGDGSVAANAFTYVPGIAQLHWITAPEPTPVYLAQVLTTQNASYTLVGGDVTRLAIDLATAAHGTVNAGTSLTANFTSQTVAVNLDATVSGHNWLASTLNAPLQYLNGNSQSGFYADSYGLPSKPGHLTVTMDAAPANGSLAGQLVGAALDGAILKFNLTSQVAPVAGVVGTVPTTFENVQGVAALQTAVANDPATSYRMVLTAINDPKATLPTVMLGGTYNNAARVLTDGAGNLTGFDFAGGGGGSGNTLAYASAGTGKGFVDQGSAVIGGATVSWGRWDAGTVLNVTDRATGALQNVTLTGGAHMVLGPLMTAPVTLPVAGNYTYAKVGNTLPTDDLGVAGTLNSATLRANFTAQTVDVGVNVTAGGATLDAVAAGVPIQQRANFFTDSKTTGPGGLVVKCSGLCGDTNQGTIGGSFGGPGGLVAALTYGFEKKGANAGTVSGVAVFKR